MIRLSSVVRGRHKFRGPRVLHPPKHPVAVLLAMTLSTNLSVGQLTTSNLRVRVMDSSGTPLSGAHLVVSGPDMQGLRGSVSDTLGYISLFSIPPGRISARISHIAYQPIEMRDIVLLSGRTRDLGDIGLKPGLIDVPEIIVPGRHLIFDSSPATMGVNLQLPELEQLPLDRNYTSVAALAPHANQSYFGDEVNVAGATGSENRYLIDGVDVTDPTFGMTGTNLPYNFVKEIDVIEGGYDAEYRAALGGLINVVTPSGSNEIHGSVFGFFTSNALSAPRRIGSLDLTQGRFSNYDVGFEMSGAVIQDQLWFHGGYNRVMNHRDVDMPGLGASADKASMNLFAGKLTWRPSDRLNLTMTSSGDPSERKAIGDLPVGTTPPVALADPAPFLTDQQGGGFNFSLAGFSLLNDRMLVEATLSRINRRQILDPSTQLGKDETVVINTETGTWSGGSFGRYSIFRDVTSARTTATLSLSSHTLRGGIEYSDKEVRADVDYANSLSRINDSLYVLILNGTHGTVHNRVASIFVQDIWDFSPALHIHAGVRWDGQFIIGGNGIVAQRIVKPVQPRTGFVLLLGRAGGERIDGYFGRFMEELHTAPLTAYYTGSGYYYEIHYDHEPSTGDNSGNTVANLPPAIQPEIGGLIGQYYDEFALGYEHLFAGSIKLGVRATYRTLREAIDDGLVPPEGPYVFGNPGKGPLTDFPKPQRDYSAVCVMAEKRDSDPFNFQASYTLSRNYGNYAGLYDAYNKNFVPNVSFTFDFVEALKKGTGLLPNDRTHVFKFSGSYRWESGLSAGASFIWETGTPLSDVAGSGWFLQQRGTSGRTPTIWDLNARLIYPLGLSSDLKARFVLDVYHIASQREPVDVVQTHYFAMEGGSPAGLNPNYGKVSRYQPPMSVRLGVELSY